MSTIRQKRAAEHIRSVLSDLLLRQMRDPRVQGVTITDVRVDRELQFADVYVNALGDEGRKQEVVAGLTRAAGFLRRELAQRFPARHVPQLHFHWDPSLARAERMHALLDDLDLAAPVEEEE